MFKDYTPSPNEWCWFWDNIGFDAPILSRFLYMKDGLYRVTHSENLYFTHCEKFVGELPTILKETHETPAQKYVTLLDNGVDFIEAYIAVFPLRYAERCVREGFTVDMKMEALLYKNSKNILEQRNINVI